METQYTRRVRAVLYWAALLMTFQAPALSAEKPLWKISDPSIQQPESAYYSPDVNTIFVSNVVGSEVDKDGQGWISKISPDGQLLEPKWVQGLNAPHGMRSQDGQLWVSDIDELVAIDIQTGVITSRIPIPGAIFLNDVAIDGNGRVLVADTVGNKIYVVDQNQVSVFAEAVDLESPNGLLVKGNHLIVAAWGTILDIKTFATEPPGHLFQLDLGAETKTWLTPSPLGNLDGVEVTSVGNLIVSDFNTGNIFLVNPDRGIPHRLLSGLVGSADIGFIPDRRLLLVPNLLENTISAYQLPF